ncbi:polyprenyl synthetase family protein [Streptomyces sp. NPDC002701]|uniref:polyprenyl synthetase family protein n=1 Tax=Streptomyces sp. NPDC002701 TaxID=3364661 RepID=UPI003684D2B8
MTAEPVIRAAREVGQVLSDAAAVTGPGLREAVGGLPQRIRHPVGVHLGWWDSAGRALEGRAGKMMRPALTLLACEAVGGQSAAGVPAAVAVELVHNASLLHDDLIDGDRMRRGRPALWSQMGMPAAVLAGDALFFLAVQVLHQAPPPLGTAGVGELTAAVQELIEGEYADVQLEDSRTAGAAESQAMAAGKTGALIAAACALGARAAGAGDEQVNRLREAGVRLGVAFQLTDDLLGIWGTSERTGKPARSDLNSRKMTAPVTAALASDTPQARELAGLYARPEPFTTRELDHLATLIEEAGGLAATRAQAEEHLTAALGLVREAATSAAAAAEFTALADLIVHRDH